MSFIDEPIAAAKQYTALNRLSRNWMAMFAQGNKAALLQ